MIRNERQYNVTKGQIRRLESALGAARETRDRMPVKVYEAMVAGLESQVGELHEQLQEYDSLKRVSALHLSSPSDLPDLLVRARVARGYTQTELALKLNVKPQQIQKYEATGYRSASLDRVLRVMEALELDLETDVRLS